MLRDPGPARSGPKGGRPRRHGGVLTFAKPDSRHEPDVTTVTDTTRCGKAEAIAWDRMHPRPQDVGTPILPRDGTDAARQRPARQVRRRTEYKYWASGSAACAPSWSQESPPTPPTSTNAPSPAKAAPTSSARHCGPSPPTASCSWPPSASSTPRTRPPTHPQRDLDGLPPRHRRLPRRQHRRRPHLPLATRPRRRLAPRRPPALRRTPHTPPPHSRRTTRTRTGTPSLTPCGNKPSSSTPDTVNTTTARSPPRPYAKNSASARPDPDTRVALSPGETRQNFLRRVAVGELADEAAVRADPTGQEQPPDPGGKPRATGRRRLEEGWTIEPEDPAHISLYLTEHINRFGEPPTGSAAGPAHTTRSWTSASPRCVATSRRPSDHRSTWSGVAFTSPWAPSCCSCAQATAHSSSGRRAWLSAVPSWVSS